MADRKTTIRLKIDSEEARNRAYEAISRCGVHSPMEMTLRLWGPHRTLSANALYWQWLTQMAKHYSQKAGPFDKDDMHDLMKHKFLGYEPARDIGNTHIPAKLKSTADLTKSEMCHYMSQVDAWCADNGLLLARPEDGEYEEWARRQNA